MILGVRNDCIAGNNLKEKMQIIKDMGYDFLELALKPEEIDDLDSHKINEYCGLAKQLELPIKNTSLGSFPLYAAKEPDERKKTLNHLMKMIELTYALGGDVILLAAKEESEEVDNYLDIYRKELADAASCADEKGIVLALEPVGRFKPSVLDSLIRGIDNKAIGMYYDMGNCIYGGQDPVDQLRLSIDIIKAIHIKGAMEIQLDGMPLTEILDILRSNNFSGRGCMEIGSQDGTNGHLEKAIKLLKGLGY